MKSKLSKSWRLLVALVLAAGLAMVVPATPAAAAEIVVPTGYATIQAAIDAAAAGDTITVCPGTYEENLVINKANLTIRSSEGKAVTTIQLPSGEAIGIDLQANAGGTTFGMGPNNGFTVLGHADTQYVLQLTNGPDDVTISYNTFDRGAVANDIVINIGAGGTDNLLVKNNLFTLYNDGDCGIYGDGAINDALIEDNTFTGEDGDSGSNSVKFVATATVDGAIVQNNTFTNNTRSDIELGAADKDGITYQCNTFTDSVIIIYEPTEDASQRLTNLNILANTFSQGDDWTTAVVFLDDANSGNTAAEAGDIQVSTIHVNYNNFLTTPGNYFEDVFYGVEGNPDPLDATNNWWNSVDGPSPCGSGADVSPNVDYCPWLGAIDTYCTSGSHPATVQPTLVVTITEPADGTDFTVSDTFAVTATVQNTSSITAKDVHVTLAITGNAELVPSDGSATFNVGNISPNSTQTVNWTLHCTDAGDVDLVATAAEGACRCGTEYSDTITVHQLGTCGLDLEITSSAVGEVCVGSTYTVTGTLTNTGDAALSGVEARLTATQYATSVSISPSGWAFTTSLAPGASIPVTWTVTCEGRELQGPDEECLDELVDFLAEAQATCVDDNDTTDSATLTDWANQKFAIVTITTPQDDTDFCVNDEWLVDASVHNCLSDLAEGSISITISDNAVLVTPPNAEQDMDIPAGGTILLSDTGGPLRWHLKCTDAGDVVITVKYLGVVDTTTICDTASITVHQKIAADIAVAVSSPDCTQYGDEFDVTATVTNTGGAGASPISNVAVVMTATGDVSQVGSAVLAGDTDEDGMLDQTETWVYTYTYECTGPDNASFAASVTGTDAVCDSPLSASSSTDYTEQIKLDVVIITPLDGTTYSACQTFCVTAEISDNDPDTCFEDPLTATINTGLTASLVAGETAAKEFALVDGDTQQISWTVHCDESGDSTISVEVTGTGGLNTVPDPDDCTLCTLTEKMDSITVHQETPPSLSIVILSPMQEENSTYVATGQDYAVTAMVSNGGQATAEDVAITLAADANATITNATQTFDIAGGASQTVTWTVHCTGSGDPDDEVGTTVFTVSASGTDENSGDTYTATDATVSVHQYGAAHLDVEITSVTPATTITVCDMFQVHYKVTNTGEADAWEVSAILSVFPEGSVRIQADHGGYTQSIGTLTGHGQAGYYEGTFYLHCKQACESTIVITAAGYDEKGYHLKQAWNEEQDVFVLSLESEPGRAIDSRFIEPASVTVKQEMTVDIAVTKTADNPSPQVNDVVTFTITASNNGPGDATGVTVTDALSSGALTLVSVSKGTYSAGVWTVGDLDNGMSATLTLSTTVATTDQITNTATATATQDDWNSYNNSASVTLNRTGTTTQTINLSTGWNLISLPLYIAPADRAIADILTGATGTWDSVFAYDAATPAWLDYDIGWATGSLTEMRDGPGYWVTMTSAGTLVVTGTEMPEGAVAPPVYDVYEGWNLIGFKSVTARTASDYLAAIAGKYTVIYRYAGGSYSAVQASDNLIPGQGYWIAIIQAGKIYP